MARLKTLSLLSLTILICYGLINYGLSYLNKTYPHLVLTQQSFAQLPAWKNDKHQQALLAFQRSCTHIQKRQPTEAFARIREAGKVSDWQTICNTANQFINPDSKTAQQFFETWFDPYRVRNNFNSHGLFTGYYLPVIQGSLTPSKRFAIPIYALPNDLVTINLGKLHAKLSGKLLIGQLKNNKLYQYPDRNAINHGAIHSQTKVLAWTDNILDIFFAHVQGSAIVELPNHERFIISYAGKNGQPYIAIGKVLLARNAIAKKNLSMQTVRHWLEEHPEEIETVLNSNASYVFFKILKNGDPLGSEQIPLTPQRSLAVDTHFIPLGAPLWLNTMLPANKTLSSSQFQHLMIAQDTGSAIKGIVRGDVYWGDSENAADIAGHMQSDGQYWILLPKRKS